MIRGSCLCGGVQFEIDGPLSPLQTCHAQRCRKASGSAFGTESAARSADFRLTCGEELIETYVAPILDEPPAYMRKFCRVCGSPLPVPMVEADFMVIQAGTLDEGVTSQVFRHVFTSEAASWFEISDDLPQHERRPPPESRVPEDEDMQ